MTCKVKGHSRSSPLKSPEFQNWLMLSMFTRFRTTPTHQALTAAVSVLHGLGGPEHQVYLRVAERR